jgi:serine/threonine protein kinase
MAMSPEVPERGRRTIAIRKGWQADTTLAAVPAAGSRAVTTAPEPQGSAPAPPIVEALPPGSRIGQYELIRLLGRGGMGEVYLARDLRLGRLVAIKFLAEHGAGVTERFLTEARATARCNHENIVVIHDVGEHDGRPYMVLEYVEGQTLGTWWSERAHSHHERAGEHGHASGARVPLAPSRAVELMLPVVRALAYAHDLGIVHRDLKPANLMLSSTDAIKVLDFGIAKLREEAADEGPEGLAYAAAPGLIIGTLPYMSPEQLEGDEVDHRTDIWAVGIMLFEMVTGTHPTMSPDGGALPGFVLDTVDLDVPMPSVSERQPDLGPLAGIIDRCLIKNREHRTSSARVLQQELEAVAQGRRAMALSEDQNPFAGLASFQEGDADRFFGRNREIAALVARLRSQPLVAVAGPSGAGKSSLVRAGVIPALKRSGEGWDAFVMRPGRRPLVALADVLVRLSQQATDRRTDEPPHAPRTRAALCEHLRAAPGQLGAELRTWAQRKHRQVVLFVDQLEELYTLGTEPAEVQAFIACLDGVADDASSPLRVILSVRSDFLDRVAEHRSFMSEVGRGLWFLSPLDRDGLREALVRPVEAMDHRYEEAGMVESMLEAVAATPGALPLLQFAASKLWSLRDRERRLLTRDSYQAMGGVAGMLASHADTVLAAMTSVRLARARDVLERLVTPERTRAIAGMSELRELPGDAGEIEQVVHFLVDARLLVIDGEGDERTVELVHESLIHGWPTLARWLDENREDAVFLDRLRGAAAQWENSDRDEGMLWRGEPAAEAHAWRMRRRGPLGRREQAYLDAVQALATRTTRRRRQLVAGTMAVLAGLLVAASVALVWIQRAEAAAREQATLARASAATVKEQYAALAVKEGELRGSLGREQQARTQAESAQRAAEQAQRDADQARQLAEAEAARAQAARDQARRSRDQAVAAAENARQAEVRARQAESEARAMQQQAEAAAEKERLARKELELLIERGQGRLDETLW